MVKINNKNGNYANANNEKTKKKLIDNWAVYDRSADSNAKDVNIPQE